jgi:hypothetical protein
MESKANAILNKEIKSIESIARLRAAWRAV